ncbi:translation machinery-associated protein 16 homolog [Chironomus tepperi]|uniref:translation machinery-associated protein 16 homolog n=1 Tax=Chironomus tepperi TaxID=113505 RepID=UPI00391EE3F4
MGSKKKLAKKIEEIKHPGSRKTVAAVRELKKIKKRENIKEGFATKANIEGKKLSYFAEQIEHFNQDKKCLTPEEFQEIIEKYFHRFDDELEQIKLKTQVNKKRQNQHANRESIIKMTLEKDIKNFNAGGIELVDLTNPVMYEKFRNWDGNAHNIQHLELKFISKKYLNQLKEKIIESQTMQVE